MSQQIQAWDVKGLKINMRCNCLGCKKKLEKVIDTIQRCEGVDYKKTMYDKQKVRVLANDASAEVLLNELRKYWKDTQLLRVYQNFPVNVPQRIRYNVETLKAATGGFHDANKLGEGGFGIVYKGTHHGKQIAVKRLSSSSRQGRPAFLKEVKVLSRIKHRNLVKLLAWCEEGSEKLLVYEYLPNKSLDTFLNDAEKRRHLIWPKRRHIILGVCHGLFYIHEGTQERIVHRDLKPSNILLDKELNPKIGDLGIARLFPEDMTHLTTITVAGTPGYMAPEYFQQGQVSVKGDVYSFGVILLQLVTGRNIGDASQEFILKWVWRLYGQQEFRRMIDAAISETCDVEEASRCIRIGLLCTQADSGRRPSMGGVYSMLSNGSMQVPQPGRPGYVLPDPVSRRRVVPRNGVM